jgi:uncharacterized protein YqeY
MGIEQSVNERLAEAMKAREAERVAALRGIRAAFLNEMKKDNAKTLSDEVSIEVLRRLAKQRRESIEAFAAAGRSDRADAERAELAVIEEFLPRLADEETTRAWVREAIAATGAGAPGDVGKVMAAVMKAHKGAVDGQLARRLAQELLAG